MRLSLVSIALAVTTKMLAAADGDPGKENTYFNAKNVPTLPELTLDTFEEEVKSTKWLFIKYYRFGLPCEINKPSKCACSVADLNTSCPARTALTVNHLPQHSKLCMSTTILKAPAVQASKMTSTEPTISNLPR